MKKPSIRSIQSQLILYFAIAILVPVAITMIVGVKLIHDEILTRAETKAIADINSAREIYRGKLSQIESVTRLTSVRSLIVAALVQRDTSFLKRDLRTTLGRENLDVLTITDSNGTVVCRGRNILTPRDTLREDVFVDRVIRTRRMITGTGIVSREWLMRESPALAEQAAMQVVPTPKAYPPRGGRETSGMMLMTGVPVFDASGRFQGVLVGGVLLNRNYELVDKINEVVHEREIYKGKEIGTATIFQGDLRISTNVKNQDGSRAVSTLVSQEVHDAVLKGGKRWLGDAFVVNAWYITAYVPIRDIEEKIIGILYVGVLRQPFDDVQSKTLVMFLGITLGAILLVVLIAVHQARRISRPLKTLEGVARQIANGDYRQEVAVDAPDEIRRLAGSISQMARKLEAEKTELEEFAATLEMKVEERTDQIKKIHSQLYRSDKLASLGKLAAGVAHEINNPLTGILTNASLLVEDIAADDPRHADVEIIVKETIRCREIVKRLLDFAKQTKPQKRPTNINTLVETIILLVRNQTSFRGVEIVKNLAPELPETLVDMDQIQQVLINIILNAAEAMTNGGTLHISSEGAHDGESVLVKFADSGPGISEEIRERIFDPFFTTKEHGTGLGLSISYGIVELHGGSISVESTPGKGSTFTVQLPTRGAEPEGH
jgi:two-component system NtrC family sensor kinase